MNPKLLGLLRGAGFAVLTAVLMFLGNKANLSGVVSDSLALLISTVALSIEHSLEAKTGKALFGAVKTR